MDDGLSAPLELVGVGRGLKVGGPEVGRGDLHGEAHRQAQAGAISSPQREPAHVGSPTRLLGDGRRV